MRSAWDTTAQTCCVDLISSRRANHKKPVRVEHNVQCLRLTETTWPVSLPERPSVGPSRTKTTSNPKPPTRRRSRSRKSHDGWQIERLSELARGGSLAAGRELIQRAIARCEQASRQHPDLFEPALCHWLKDLLAAAFRNPRQSVGHLLAPPQKRVRALTHAELVEALSLSQEAHYRVRKMTDAGVLLKDACTAVAEELNALGYRNANSEPLTATIVQRRFYEVSRSNRTDGDEEP